MSGFCAQLYCIPILEAAEAEVGAAAEKEEEAFATQKSKIPAEA
jgi:hypothetical protein